MHLDLSPLAVLRGIAGEVAVPRLRSTMAEAAHLTRCCSPSSYGGGRLLPHGADQAKPVLTFPTLDVPTFVADDLLRLSRVLPPAHLVALLRR